MPLRTARPSYRIDSLPLGYLVTAYPVVNRQRIKGKSVLVPLNDSAAFAVAVTDLIIETRARYAPREK